jgi:Sensors of blue-light using FAD
MLVRLLYASRLSESSSADAVESIVQMSRQRNPDLGITGVLCHDSRVIVQALEGGRDAVNAIYQHICRDPRHRDVTLLAYDEIAERRFAGWTMGLVNLTKLNSTLLLKYCEKAALDPYQLSGRAVFALLEELVATAAICGRA